jgi:5,10-methylenetetrahydromethanopterin reductase
MSNLTTQSYGVVFPARAQPELLPAFARRIEELGYDELWVVEDCFLSGGLTLAATALAVTSRLSVGIGLLPAAVRSPAIAAMEIATLSRIHPGRLSVAFGHGVEAWMQQIGARPPHRVRALGEVVSAVRALLSGQTLDVDGSFVSLADVGLDFPPKLPPPILIGTTGPAGIAAAARRADGLLLPEGCGPRFIAHARDVMSNAGTLGGSVPEIVAYAWLSIGEDDSSRKAMSEAIVSWRESGLYPGPVGVAPTEAGQLSDELAVAGDPESCAASVQRFREAGAHRVIMVAVGEETDDQYTRFATDVLPALRRA